MGKPLLGWLSIRCYLLFLLCNRVFLYRLLIRSWHSKNFEGDSCFGGDFHIKYWHPNFNPASESFDSIPLWLRLSKIQICFWNAEVFQSVGNHIGCFLISSEPIDSRILSSARICIETDTGKGLAVDRVLNMDDFSWTPI